MSVKETTKSANTKFITKDNMTFEKVLQYDIDTLANPQIIAKDSTPKAKNYKRFEPRVSASNRRK